MVCEACGFRNLRGRNLFLRVGGYKFWSLGVWEFLPRHLAQHHVGPTTWLSELVIIKFRSSVV